MATYNFDEKPETKISDSSAELYESLKSRPLSCLVGPNNSGKSFILKKLTEELGGTATYLGPARYSNFNTLTPFQRPPDWKSRKYRNLINSIRNNQENIDKSPFNIQQAIAELNDSDREKLFKMVEQVMGAKLELALADPDNAMSQRYVSCDGHNFSYASSGTRLIASILASLLDKDFTHFLIDEPELGVSPESQGRLADFVFDDENRYEYFPHAEVIIFATHSTIFLHRTDLRSNFFVSKDGDAVEISGMESLADFNKAHFSLLGNRLEKLHLPSIILLVEGESDEKFLSRALSVRYPDLDFSIIPANSDSQMKNYAHMLRQVFPDLPNSPFAGRIIPILDSIHDKGVIEAFEKKGINRDSVVVWSRNGIEHFYPPQVMDQIFGAGGAISIMGDEISRNGTKLRKANLARKVADKLSAETVHHHEVEEKLFSKVDAIIY